MKSQHKRLFLNLSLFFLSFPFGFSLLGAESADSVIYILEEVKRSDKLSKDILRESATKSNNDLQGYYPSYTELETLVYKYINEKDPRKGMSKLETEWPGLIEKYGSSNVAYVLKKAVADKINEYDFDLASRLIELALSIPMDSYPAYDIDRNQFLLNKLQLQRTLGNYQECINIGRNLLQNLDSSQKERGLIYQESRMQREILDTLKKIYYDLGNFYEWSRYEVLYLQAELNRPGYMSDQERANLTKALDFFISADFSSDWQNSMEQFMGLMFDDQMLEEKLKRMNEMEADSNYVPGNLFVKDDLAELYSDICYIYYYRKDYAQALNYAQKAVEMFRDSGGTNESSYNKALEGLAKTHMKLGQWSEAIPVLKELISIRTFVLGPNHPFNIENRQRLAKNLLHLGDKKAIEEADGITKTMKSYVKDNFAYMAADERKKLWDLYSEWFFETLPMIARRFNSQKAKENAYDGLLLGKGLLLNTERELRNLIEDSGDTDLLDKYNRLKALKAQVMAMERAEERDMAKIGAISTEADRIEKELVRESRMIGDCTANMTIGWKDVRDNLNDGEAAVEFLALTDASTGRKDYIALLLRKDSKAPELIELFSSEQLEVVRTDDYYKNATLYNSIWAPLESCLKDVSTVYFSPDDMLHTIALEYLPTGNCEEIASDRRKLIRLSSTRLLAIQRDNSKAIKNAALYGDILYGADYKEVVSNEGALGQDWDLLIGESNDNVGKRVRSLSTSTLISSLPGTKREVEEIDTLLREANVNDRIYSGSNASETSFKQLSGKQTGLIHVATHGFYLSPKIADVYDYSFLGDIPSVEDEAMSRCGLFFACAENVLKNEIIPDGVDDGILTARELAWLDLRGLDLAVLSACQTGLGDISGEGVFGLQRGFKKAGAKSLLMSLWKVDDEATRLLMAEFYKNFMQGKSKYDSLQAGRKLLKDFSTTDANGNETRPYDFPQYLNAFILLDAAD